MFVVSLAALRTVDRFCSLMDRNLNRAERPILELRAGNWEDSSHVSNLIGERVGMNMR